MKKILSIILILTMLSFYVGGSVAMEYNLATNWAAEAVFGIDGPAPFVGTESLSTGWNEYIKNYDVAGAVDAAYRAGAKYFQLNAMSAYGGLVAPNSVLDEYLGTEPGKVCATRDLIADFYTELSKKGMKLVLYLVNDGIYNRTDINAALSFHQGIDDFYEKWSDVIECWMKRYGEKIAGIWWDGSYPYLGYEYSHFKGYEEMIKKYSPNCIIAFSESGPLDGKSEFKTDGGASDYTAGETYGLGHIPDGAWKNKVRFHRYMPLYEYTEGGSSVAVDDLTDYVKKVRGEGGFITFGTRNNDPDEVQIELLAKVREALTDETYKNTHKSGKIIEAVDCNRMTQAYFIRPRTAVLPILKSDKKGTTFVNFQTLTPEMTNDSYWLAGNQFTDTRRQSLNITFENVEIERRDRFLTICYKNNETDNGFVNRLEMRVGELDAKPMISLKNVESIAWFMLDNNFYTGDVPEGFRLAYFSIPKKSGTYDIHFSDVLREELKNKSAGTYRQMADVSYIPAEAVNGSVLIYKSDGRAEYLDHGDIMAFADVNFESGYSKMLIDAAVDDSVAGQKMYIYADVPGKRTKLLGTWKTESTGGFTTYERIEIPLIKYVGGKHDIFLVFVGTSGVANIKGFKFQ